MAAAFSIGSATARVFDQRASLDQPTSNPSKQHKNDNDNQDGADNADATVSVAITIATEAAAEAAEQENDENDKKNKSQRHNPISFALRQLMPHRETKCCAKSLTSRARGLRRTAAPAAGSKNMKI
jgi:hypothetical protein